MKNINLKGVTAEAITGVLVLLIALINAVLQMFGINTLPIENEEVTNIVSTVFLIVTVLYNTWKNRNVTTISQEVQQIAGRAGRHGLYDEGFYAAKNGMPYITKCMEENVENIDSDESGE